MATTSLPEGWTSKHHDVFDKTEYFHEATGKSSFLHPSVGAPPAVSSPWERETDDKGRSYYSNHDDKTTSWKNPVDDARLKAEAKDEDDWVVGYRTDAGEEWWVDYKTGQLTSS